VHLEVWVPAPGRLFSIEWKPWIVPSPVLVRPERKEASAPRPIKR
jgi:hypothetical protein